MLNKLKALIQSINRIDFKKLLELAATIALIVAAITFIKAQRATETASTQLTMVASNANGLIADLRQDARTIKPLIESATYDSETLRQFMDQARIDLHNEFGKIDQLTEQGYLAVKEGQYQMKQNGDQARKVLGSLDETVRSANSLISDSRIHVLKFIDASTSLVETADDGLNKTFEDFHVVIRGDNGFEGLVKRGNENLDQSKRILAAGAGASEDLQGAVHGILHPKPCKGVGCKVKWIIRNVKEFGAAAYVVEKLLP